MAITPFLAMTAAEMAKVSDFPPKVAWMACHFSPYGLGLSNLPQNLPHQAVIVLDDITPIRNHDSGIITEQLLSCAEAFQCSGILLDFQRPDSPETEILVRNLSKSLPCPVIVSPGYAGELSCPVLLPPVPPSVSLKEHLSPWNGRELWMEIGFTGERLTLTNTGCTTDPLCHPDIPGAGFPEQILHCHYAMETTEKAARFTLWRTMEDWYQLLAKAEAYGVSGAVGLYQELKAFL